jgi:uncharacterized RDD family membrane protein YckC
VAHVYSIETPESLSLSFRRAGLATRALALCIDLGVMAALLQTSVWALSALELFASSAASALWIVTGFVVQWGYGALSEWLFAGRTLGKRLFHIVVIDAAGLRITFAQAALRNLLRLADLLPGCHLLGCVVSLCDPHGRRLGDLAARTLVVRDEQRTAPASTKPSLRAGEGASALLANPRGVRLGAAEKRALDALCDNLERLPLAERFALCQALAQHLSQRLGIATAQAMSSEKFLLLVQRAAVNTKDASNGVRRSAIRQES